MGKTDVYTDGACKGNPGPGGWAWVVPDGPFGNGGAEQTTNQRMELEAVLRAVESIEGSLCIHSDSTYVVNCFEDRWFDGWLARGWKNSQKKPVANRDLWEPLIGLYLARTAAGDEITFVWVKGHAGHEWNERADALAVEAAEAAKAGVAERAVAPAVVEPAPWPVERAIWVTGVRDLDDDQRAGLARAIDGLDAGRDLLVTGLRRGAELEAAELARSRRIELAVVLPFADPAARWPQRDRDRFESIRSSASYEVVLEGDAAAPGTAVAQRNEWVLPNVIGVIVVGDQAAVDQAEAAGHSVVTVDAG